MSFSVPFRYPVLFTDSIFEPTRSDKNLSAAHFLDEIRPKIKDVIVDSGVVSEPPGRLAAISSYFQLEPLVLAGGEQIKQQTDLVDFLHARWTKLKLDRHSQVVLIGGGSFLDATGFAASLFHRGLGHIRFPSTVLAQNDAGIGVKNGLNRLEQKNLLGAFYPPTAVINEVEFLNSLSERDHYSGYAEAVKVALIRSPEFFTWLESNSDALATKDPQAVQKLIEDCARLHLTQISGGGDPFESGSARPLDFGHWLAHRLEVLSQHELLHGEAVSIGVALDTALSFQKSMISEAQLRRVILVLQSLRLPVFHALLAKVEDENSLALDTLYSGLEDFRQHLGGELCIELLGGIGKGISVNSVEKSEVFAAIQTLKRFV